jgi:hypothetical protein
LFREPAATHPPLRRCRCEAEQLESRLANGEQIDIAEHAALSSTLVRLASRIGIDRVARDVTSLGSILRADFEERRSAEATARERTSELPNGRSGHPGGDGAVP